MRFEWAEDKATSNLGKHGVDFREAVLVFDDVRAVEAYDAEHSLLEPRFWRIGWSGRRLLYVVFVERNKNIRLIHARKADSVMGKIYARQNED